MSNYSVGLPLSPYSQRFGYESDARYKCEQRRALTIIQQQRRIVKEATVYEQSYLSSSTKTVLHFRDYLLAEAAAAFVFNTQFTTSDHNTLTNHANKVWSAFSFDDMWSYIPPNPQLVEKPPKYWGELGTLAYYSLWVDQSASLPEVMQRVLKLVWGLVGCSFNHTPRQRTESLLTSIEVRREFLTSIEAKANLIFSLMPEDDNYYLLQAARRNRLSKESFTLLTQRVLLGEYDKNIFVVLAPILSNFEQQTLSLVLSNCLDLLKPGGMGLLCQALIVEAYLQAAFYLSSLDDDILVTSLLTFQNSSIYNLHTAKIAEYLSLAYDSYSLLNMLSVRSGLNAQLTMLEQQILSWLSFSGISISPSSLYRFDNLL